MAWECKYCTVEEIPPFETEIKLKEHNKSHSSHFVCPTPWCTFIGKTEESLIEHIFKCNMPSDPVKCSVKNCDVEYSTEGAVENYRKHLKHFHSFTAKKAAAMIDAEKPKPEEADPETDFEDPEDGPAPKKQKIELPDIVYDIPVPVNETDRKLLKYGRLSILYGYSIRGPRVAHMRLTKENLNPPITNKNGPGPGKEERKLLGLKQMALRADFVSSVNGQQLERGHPQGSFFLRVDAETAKAISMYSVMLPQFKEFNRGAYHDLERYVEWLLQHNYDVIDSFTGGLYGDDIGKSNRLPIASHFFMLLICHLPDGMIDVEIFILEHKEHQPGIGINTFHKSYDVLLRMDRDNFIPRFNFKNLRKFNGMEVEKPAAAPTAPQSE